MHNKIYIGWFVSDLGKYYNTNNIHPFILSANILEYLFSVGRYNPCIHGTQINRNRICTCVYVCVYPYVCICIIHAEIQVDKLRKCNETKQMWFKVVQELYRQKFR